MILDFITNGIFWVLAIYGLIEIMKVVYNFFTYTNLKEGRYNFNNRSEESGRKNRVFYSFHII